MAHYAKIENGLVAEVIVSDYAFVSKLDGTWLKTSYNMNGGVHARGKTPLRKNFAGIGMIYDADLDAFYDKQPYSSWSLNTETCLWEAPVAMPDDGKLYNWDESILNWVVLS